MKAAEIAIAAGADGITAHLREDRRHIVDDDIVRLKERINKPLNLEMAATPEMVGIARKLKPHAVCIVPERRQERTTEGGLDAAGQREPLRAAVGELADAGIRVSLFIAAEPAQIEAAAAIGAPVIEIHTGAWCDALAAADAAAAAAAEFERIVRGAALARSAGLEVHAGHGLDFFTAEKIAALGRDRRTQYRAFSDRRSDFHGSSRCGYSRCARLWIGAGPELKRDRKAMILGIGSDITDVRRIAKVHRAPRRPFPRPRLHADRTRQGRQAAQPGRDLRQAICRQGSLRQGAGNRTSRRRLVARHGRGQFAGRSSDHGTDRRRQTPSAENHAGRITRRASISPSPTRARWRMPSSIISAVAHRSGVTAPPPPMASMPLAQQR